MIDAVRKAVSLYKIRDTIAYERGMSDGSKHAKSLRTAPAVDHGDTTDYARGYRRGWNLSKKSQQGRCAQ